MQLAELLSGLKYNTFGVNLRGYVKSISNDSRTVAFGGLFICVKGSKRDGHEFAEEAIRRGAVAVVTERYIKGVPCIVVKNTRVADSVIWDNFYGNPSRKMRMIAVTGTNGKTSTAAYLASAMNEGGIKTAVIGTLGCSYDGKTTLFEGSAVCDISASMTTPDPKILYKILCQLHRKGAEAVVMEASSHAIAQHKLCPIRFEIGVFTNLTPEHLDFHESMEDYYKTKASLIKKCRKAVIGCDSAYGRRLWSELGCKAASCDRSEAKWLRMSENGVSYELELCGETICVSSSSPGFFTVENTMLAAKAAYMLGVSQEKICRGIAAVPYVSGRMEKITECEKYGFHVFIDYAHTSDALASAINCIKSIAGGRYVTVLFGCGGDRDKSKRAAMGGVAVQLADRVIITSDNPRSEKREDIISHILSGIKCYDNVRVIVDRRTAIEYAISTAKREEFILLCGKGHEKYETDAYGNHPFSEKDIVLSALSRL
ncbi:MAG: UDP-N-acetylmuramoyl-L-alanyl-D-glutamate--2,6-diaminopimelate ligase [Clostridia bacterium]|nr:UDP-N-acetylmuramoyl-L-alanyl-D-glutamate--2,6-diaminopimelate ligase [Clostridia bacterium]